MQIREANQTDLPEILNVLKASLGEVSSKKTEEVWSYKHINNPFGKSLIFVAEDSGKIIGVRAFMRWQWKKGYAVYSAFRAVDTATHPDHQGKGIFKQLTLKALEIAKERNEDFVFNTPNSQSLPGYLKMEWKEVEKLKIRARFVSPFYWIKSRQRNIYEIYKNSNNSGLADLILQYNELQTKENKFFTIKSPEYLYWRYEINPLQKYEVVADEDFYVSGYIKQHKFIKELRITEHIFRDKQGLRKINKVVDQMCKNFGAQVVTSTGLKSGLNISGNFGPVLTIRDVNLTSVIKQELLQLNNWSYTLGDLELF